MIKNKYKCSTPIWRKFSDAEKQQYNKIRDLIAWPELYHAAIKGHAEIMDVTAHNIACQLVWNG